MTNLPREHHRLDTHARHRAKALTTLLWTARFRWTASGIIDELLGGNGLVRMLIDRHLLVEHRITNPFSPIRYYVTLSTEGLALLEQHWPEIEGGAHGDIARCLSCDWKLPSRPEHRIREARFEHDLHVQYALCRSFQSDRQITRVSLADDLERVPLTQRPTKIPDVIVTFELDSDAGAAATTTLWGEVEYSRKNRREIDVFCAFYRAAMAGQTTRDFDKVVVLCHQSVLAQWRSDFARTVVPNWHFRKATRDWVKLDAKDWHHFPEMSSEDINAIIRPLD
ncbi:hypothetical protein GALL_304290 [mine drainage metagenome]|uniref:Uncharacterized protein n=1 Tax=mine drainage metagenome TaxID=410659 RepID=A0A1J5R6Q4_9ZZZZ